MPARKEFKVEAIELPEGASISNAHLMSQGWENESPKGWEKVQEASKAGKDATMHIVQDAFERIEKLEAEIKELKNGK